jgi:hypothetical protein
MQTDFCVQIKFLLKPLIKLPEMMVFDCQELYICRYDTVDVDVDMYMDGRSLGYGHTIDMEMDMGTGILNVSVIGCEVCSGLNDWEGRVLVCMMYISQCNLCYNCSVDKLHVRLYGTGTSMYVVW